MKPIVYLTGILFLTIILSGCRDEDMDQPGRKITVTKSTEKLISGDNAFGFDLFKEVVNANDPDTNVFISPLSVSLALAMTYNGAAGETKTGMETTLRKEGFTTAEINVMYKDLTDALLAVDPKVVMEIANSIWYRQNLPVLQPFIEDNMNYYNAEVNELNFDAPDAKDIINNWVSEKTHEKITKIINNIPEAAVMYLINAIYFKGTWMYEFEEDKTEEEEFYLSDNTYKAVLTMKQQGEFGYSENNLFSSVELPYGDGNYSMVVMVPEWDKTVNDIIAELNPENWQTWIGSFSKQEIVIHLPKFKFRFFDSLNTPLINMGMEDAFNPVNADFSGITGERNVFISRVLHKTYVEVNEEGTEAAAVTAVEVNLTTATGGGETIPHFRANKPFLFVIKEKDTNAIIFIGKVMFPIIEEE